MLTVCTRVFYYKGKTTFTIPSAGSQYIFCGTIWSKKDLLHASSFTKMMIWIDWWSRAPTHDIWIHDGFALWYRPEPKMASLHAPLSPSPFKYCHSDPSLVAMTAPQVLPVSPKGIDRYVSVRPGGENIDRARPEWAVLTGRDTE